MTQTPLTWLPLTFDGMADHRFPFRITEKAERSSRHQIMAIQKRCRGRIERVVRKVIRAAGREFAAGAMEELNSSRAEEQLNCFFAQNHRWVANLAERNRRTAVSTYDFIDATMPGAVFKLDQFAVIRSKRTAITSLNGPILDLGVYKGESTRGLAQIFPDATIHGFDSFEGLPRDWSIALAGHFGDVDGMPPDVPANVRLYKGWFSDTLPPWALQHAGTAISLLRVDCDIYSSTKTAFDVLGPMLRAGSWILFDELIGYRGWQDHEYRAFTEFLQESGLDCEYVAYGLTYVLVKLVGGG